MNTFHYTQYRSGDRSRIRDFVARFPLALISSCVDGQWQSSHIPLFFDDASDTLFGHVDASNGQFDLADAQPLSVQLVFAGPNLYIPPEAYASGQLPTWNYLAVHAVGTLGVVEAMDDKLAILRASAQRLGSASGAFRVRDDDPRIQRWIGGIRGIRIAVDAIEGRFKLSQDKAPEDVTAAAQYFARTAAAQLTPELLLSYAIMPTATERAI